MSETSEVLAAIERLRSMGARMALATIIDVRGSTYRRPGARLLVPEEGEPIGNLSGGCLEGEVESVARDVMASGRPQTSFYDLTAEDEAVWGWGLGCNGAIEVLVEPADRAAEFAAALRTAIEQEQPVAAVVVVGGDHAGIQVGERLLVFPDGEVRGSLRDDGVHAAAVEAAGSALASGRSLVVGSTDASGTARIFVEVLEPPLRLLVCGAGHDAIPLVASAGALGWRVIVADDREAMLEEARFPGASTFVRTEPLEVATEAGVDERTYAVVMSHNYLRDRDYLKSLLGSRAAYIGMLGPHARLERLFGDLREEGIEPSEDDLRRVHGPAGLDIGGDGPEQIAVALVAEVLAVSSERRGGFLRGRSGPIHERPQGAEV